MRCRLALGLLLAAAAVSAATADGGLFKGSASGAALSAGPANATFSELLGKAKGAVADLQRVLGANGVVLKAAVEGSGAFLGRQTQRDALIIADAADNKTGVPFGGKLRGVFGAVNGARGGLRQMAREAQDAAETSLASIKKVVRT